jgi:hypothetical protein
MLRIVDCGIDCIDEGGGAAGLIAKCLLACNHDVRLRAARHIIVVGDGADIPGFH